MRWKKSRVIYKDKKGYEWTEANIEDLLKALASFKDFIDTFDYYKHRL